VDTIPERIPAAVSEYSGYEKAVLVDKAVSRIPTGTIEQA